MARSANIRSAYTGQRMMRRPKHTFHVKCKPFVIQPFMIAPVLPGETMKNALMQSRVVTDPLTSPLVGWWCGYWWFYVKHRDLHERDDLTEMMLDMDKDMSSLISAADVKYYHGGAGINWAKLCLQRVVEEYWRNEGEAWDAYTIDGMPVGSINQKDFANSFIPDDLYETGEVDVDLNADSVITTSEIDTALRTWQMMRANNMTDMSYEDYLATHGVRTARQELHKPELLRFVQDWGYPTNTINPENGEPSTAQSWSIADRIDKDRYFSEPGFIIGITCTRPKVYLKNFDGAAANFMTDALSWLPAIMHDDPATSLKHFAQGAGALSTYTDTDGYWLDMRDLFMYGDQFMNFDPATVTDANIVNLPTTAGQRYYPASDDVTAMFAGTTPPCLVHHDGVVNLTIASHNAIDHTPGTAIG